MPDTIFTEPKEASQNVLLWLSKPNDVQFTPFENWEKQMQNDHIRQVWSVQWKKICGSIPQKHGSLPI